MGNNAWRWGRTQQEAFEQLKKQLAEDIVLTIPTNKGKFWVEADASEGALAPSFLRSKMANGDLYCSYPSHSQLWNATTRSTTRSCSQSCLLSRSGDITLWAHTKTSRFGQITKISNTSESLRRVNWWQARWITELAEYHFTLHHKAGTANKKADLLS